MLGFGPVASSPVCARPTDVPIWRVTTFAVKDDSVDYYKPRDKSLSTNTGAPT